MAEEFYLVQIGSIYLTESGGAMDRACLTKVEGLAGLFLAYTGSTRLPISGMPFNSIRENEAKGVPIRTKPFVVSVDVLDDLKGLIDTALAANAVIPVVISDGPGSQSVDCVPFFETGRSPLDFGENFFDADLYDVSINLITAGFTV